MLSFDKPWDWLIIAVLVIILFGYKKLPDAARSVGRSLRIFKTEIKGMTEDDKARQANQAPEPPKALPPAEVVRRDVQPARAGGDRPRPSPRPNP